ncbi:MAG: helix-turn-helix domain-containing protein [Defluviitaleaceae bacterium]|nr:helix-turn-helix domain-containing protein [Defluviitaleaceae bacterium]
MNDKISFADFPDVLSIDDVQKALRIGRSMAYKLVNNGEIRHLRIGRLIKIPKQYLVDYIHGGCYSSGVVAGNLSSHNEGGER